MKRRVSLRHATSHFLQETRLKNIKQLEQKGKQERKKSHASYSQKMKKHLLNFE